MKNNSNISQELLESVERFYTNTMSQEERKDFESRLNADEEFRTSVEDIRTLILGIENQSLKEQLDVFHDDIQDPTTNTASTWRFSNIRKLAAVVIIMLSIGGFWWFSTPEHEKLYSEFFTPDPGLPTTMSSNSNFEFYDAMVNYKQGDYKTAIEKWEAIHGKNDTLNYFLGVAHLANDNEKKAIRFLEKVTQNSEFALSDEAYYYLALAQLKEGKVKEAKQNLEHSNIDNGKILLSKLND